MSSRGKKKTTMAKLSRESRLRERRVEKEARKQARRDGAHARSAEERWLSPDSPSPPESPTLDQGTV
jgi:hypothetical protein